MAPGRQAAVDGLGMAMQRYQRSVQAFDDAVGRRLGLNPSAMRCLDHLVGGPCTAGELATATGLRPAATTALIDRLVQAGFVERSPSEADRRQVLVRMTEDGYRRVGEFYGPLVADGQQLLRKLTIAELTAMREHLEAITALTERHTDAAKG
ncbi:MarR family transcriptional regulator [Nakamurella sp. YIM 132087]|uniref:MarR family transcriptional regulator n=1 Tax=Nakamurella alba TaxID=2665158 RepID=A0A7K1FL08_9ACTN|nr:MarR family transcriptional regulator [Nakamurella alba]MTD14825.1 MarR family transcriptional regulator [Nakamurella alba]